ncbi:MAG: hypothetical protein IPN91_07340 [Holophagaceae bacterium]|jgi:hypothetical protein|uniref:TIGR03067 domain-containing protein n=1 Tax=Candidatus Geothrix odensensis TaxID=2954440 RepID=A0A936F1U2_9BACT|nr:hypothetical protein [Candidatus Geothrix odensensis]
MTKTLFRLIILAQLAMVTPSVISQESQVHSIDIQQIIGSWEGRNKQGEVAVIQFQPGGTVQFTLNGKPLVPMMPNEGTLKFRINQDKSPMWLDLIALDSTGRELGQIKFIFQLINPKELKLQAGEDLTVRPEKFNESDPSKTVIFKKYY